MFFIEPCKPTPLKKQKVIVTDLSEAIETIYSMNNRAYLVWNNYTIPLCYKYDISVIIEDILPMLQKICLFDYGNQKIYFGSDTFNCVWYIKWNNDFITIRVEWDNVRGNIEDKLNELTSNTVEISDFIKQWYKILLNIKTGIDYSEIIIINPKDYKQLTYLLSFF